MNPIHSCPACHHDSQVLSARYSQAFGDFFRRRICTHCKLEWGTSEVIADHRRLAIRPKKDPRP